MIEVMKLRLPGGGWIEVPAIKGTRGPKGDSGWFRIADVYPTLMALRAAFPTGNENMYLVESDNECYVWSATANDWVSVGTIQGPPSIIESDTPPTDTTKFWRDTTDGKIKYYDPVTGTWKAVGSGTSSEKVGDIKMTVRAMPSNWLVCDGSYIDETEYPELAAILPEKNFEEEFLWYDYLDFDARGILTFNGIDYGFGKTPDGLPGFCDVLTGEHFAISDTPADVNSAVVFNGTIVALCVDVYDYHVRVLTSSDMESWEEVDLTETYGYQQSNYTKLFVINETVVIQDLFEYNSDEDPIPVVLYSNDPAGADWRSVRFTQYTNYSVSVGYINGSWAFCLTSNQGDPTLFFCAGNLSENPTLVNSFEGYYCDGLIKEFDGKLIVDGFSFDDGSANHVCVIYTDDPSAGWEIKIIDEDVPSETFSDSSLLVYADKIVFRCVAEIGGDDWEHVLYYASSVDGPWAYVSIEEFIGKGFDSGNNDICAEFLGDFVIVGSAVENESSFAVVVFFNENMDPITFYESEEEESFYGIFSRKSIMLLSCASGATQFINMANNVPYIEPYSSENYYIKAAEDEE